MANTELTDIERETFPALPQLYDLIQQSPTGYIKIVREEKTFTDEMVKEKTRPFKVKENAKFSGEEIDALIKGLSFCEELFPTDDIHCVPDGIALNIDHGLRRLPRGVDTSLQSTLLDMDDFLENKEYGERLNLVVYFSKDCWVSLHVLNLKKENPRGRVFFRFPSEEKYKGCGDLELTEELQNLFVLAQDIVMKKAMKGELYRRELDHE